MAKLFWIFGVVALALATLAVVARADDWADCENAPTTEAKISGCSAIIAAGTETQSRIAMAYNQRGLARIKSYESENALKDFDKAIELDPKVADVYFNRGSLYFNQGNYQLAIKDLDQATSLAPGMLDAYLFRGTAHFRSGEYDEALRDSGAAITIDQNSAMAYNNRGGAYREKGDYDLALSDLDRAIALDPSFSRAYYNRGLVFEKQGNIPRATADYKKALEWNSYETAAAVALNRLAPAPTETAKTSDDTEKPTDFPAAETAPARSKLSRPAAQVVSSKASKAISNTDISGKLIAKKDATNSKACAAQCSSDGACVTWTFNVWNAMCFTKSSADELLFEPSSVSGMAAGKSPPPKSDLAVTMVRYRGKRFDISKGKQTAAGSYEDCEASCKKSKACAVFTWVGDEENACYLISQTTAAYESEPEMDSGVKRQVAQ
jgi:tetratricopeptide (TPR) repeat protein